MLSKHFSSLPSYGNIPWPRDLWTARLRVMGGGEKYGIPSIYCVYVRECACVRVWGETLLRQYTLSLAKTLLGR